MGPGVVDVYDLIGDWCQFKFIARFLWWDQTDNSIDQDFTPVPSPQPH